MRSKIDPNNMVNLEEEAGKLLNEDEFNAVFRHIKMVRRKTSLIKSLRLHRHNDGNDYIDITMVTIT